MGRSLSQGWSRLKRVTLWRKVNNCNTYRDVKHGETLSGDGSATEPKPLVAPFTGALDIHDRNTEVTQLRQLVTQLQNELEEAKRHRHASASRPASSQPPSAALDAVDIPQGAPTLSQQQLPVASVSSLNPPPTDQERIASSDTPQHAVGTPCGSPLQYAASSPLSDSLKPPHRRRSSSTSISMNSQVMDPTPRTPSTFSTPEVAPTPAGNTLLSSPHSIPQQFVHGASSLPASPSAVTFNSPLVHAANSPTPTALLVLGSQPPTATYGTLSVCLPCDGSNSRLPGPIATTCNSTSHDAGGTDSKSAITLDLGTPRSGRQVSGVISGAAGGGPMTTTPTPAAAAASATAIQTGSSFSTIWVNTSAQEELLLEAVDEYDSVLSCMSRRDPALAVFLKELARKMAAVEASCEPTGLEPAMAASAALPPAVTHLVPGGAHGGLRLPNTSKSQTQQQGQLPTSCSMGSSPGVSRQDSLGSTGAPNGFTVLRMTPCIVRLLQPPAPRQPPPLVQQPPLPVAAAAAGLPPGVKRIMSTGTTTGPALLPGTGPTGSPGSDSTDLLRRAASITLPYRPRRPPPPVTCDDGGLVSSSSAVGRSPPPGATSGAAAFFETLRHRQRLGSRLSRMSSGCLAVNNPAASTTTITSIMAAASNMTDFGGGNGGGGNTSDEQRINAPATPDDTDRHKILLWERPGLMVEHLQGDTQGALSELNDRLQRDCSILSAVSAIITLFDLRGAVMHQNALSVSYLGYHKPPPPPPVPVLSAAASRRRGCGVPSRAASGDGYVIIGGGVSGPLFPGRPSVLERLFELEPSKLSEMWAAVLDDRIWRGIVCVPGSLLSEVEHDSEDGEGSTAISGEQAAGLRDSRAGVSVRGRGSTRGGSANGSEENVIVSGSYAAVYGEGGGSVGAEDREHLVNEFPVLARARPVAIPVPASPHPMTCRGSSLDPVVVGGGGSGGDFGVAAAAAAGAGAGGAPEPYASSGGLQRSTASDLEGASHAGSRCSGALRSRLAVGSPLADADVFPQPGGPLSGSPNPRPAPRRGILPPLILPPDDHEPEPPEHSTRPQTRRMRRNSSVARVPNSPLKHQDDAIGTAPALSYDADGGGSGGSGRHRAPKAAASTPTWTTNSNQRPDRHNGVLSVALFSTSNLPNDPQGRFSGDQELTSLFLRTGSLEGAQGQAAAAGGAPRPVVRTTGTGSGSSGAALRTPPATVGVGRKRVSYSSGQRPCMVPPLYGTWGRRGSPVHTPPSHAGLDLEAMTTSSWSLVVPPTESVPRRGRCNRPLRSYAGTPNTAGPAAATIQDSSCHDVTSPSGQTPRGGRSTPLPRVVFFAAASVQRDSERQKQQQQRRRSDTISTFEHASSSLTAPVKGQQHQQPTPSQHLPPAQRPSTTGYPAASEATERTEPTPRECCSQQPNPRLQRFPTPRTGTDENGQQALEIPLNVAHNGDGGGGSTTASDSDVPSEVVRIVRADVRYISAAAVAAGAAELSDGQAGASGLSAPCTADGGDSDCVSLRGTGLSDGDAKPPVSRCASFGTPLGALPTEVEAAAAAFLANATKAVATVGSGSGGGREGAAVSGAISAAVGSDGAHDANGGGDDGGAATGMPVNAVGGDCAPRWHQVEARPFRDPVSRRRCVLLVQMDVTAKVEMERRLAELVDAEHKILEQIFPRHVLEHMALDTARAAQCPSSVWELFRRDPSKLATKHQAVSILFADIKGFTNMCQEVQPEVVMTFLNELYNRFDTLLDVYGVYKVETIGDCYMVAGGLIRRDEEGFTSVHQPGAVDPLHAVRVMAFAKSMLREASSMRLPGSEEPLRIRIGIHSGPVVSGVVGTRMPRFCLFGDTVNTASRMESTAQPGTIHVSEDTRRLLHKETWRPTGGVQVKGKGIMNTFVWQGNQMELAPHLVEPTDSGNEQDSQEGPGGAELLAQAIGLPIRCRTAPREDLPASAAAALCRAISGTTRPRRSVTSSRFQVAHVLLRRGGVALNTKGLFRLNVGRLKDKQRLCPALSGSRRERGEGGAATAGAVEGNAGGKVKVGGNGRGQDGA